MIYFFIFAVSFIVAFLVTPNIRYLALKFYVVDKRNHRKVHKKIVTKLGGLAIYLGFLGGLVIIPILNIDFFQSYIFQIFGLLICSTLMLILGMYDDFQGSNALTKLLIQSVAALLLIKIGLRLEYIYIPGLIDLNLGRLSTFFTLLWLLGITNAINLIDGLDGLAAGIIAIASFFFCLYGFSLREDFIIYIALALMGANLAFLKYNFHPAKIFMGDTGSLFLGFTIGSLAIYRPNPVHPANLFFPAALILLLLPVVDTTLAILRRFLRKQYIFAGDSSHIHHYYIKRGYGQTQTVKRFYLMTFLLGTASLLIIHRYLFFK